MIVMTNHNECNLEQSIYERIEKSTLNSTGASTMN